MGFLTCWMQGQAQEGDQVYSSYSSTLWNQEYVFCMLGSEVAICPLLWWEISWKSLNFIHAQIYVYVWNSKDVSCFPVILLSQLKLIFCVWFSVWFIRVYFCVIGVVIACVCIHATCIHGCQNMGKHQDWSICHVNVSKSTRDVAKVS